MAKNKRLENLEDAVRPRIDQDRIRTIEVHKDYGDGVVVVELWELEGPGMRFVRCEDDEQKT